MALPQTVRLLVLAAGLLVTSDVMGHADYFRSLGTFVRSDGTPITVQRYLIDGIIMRDPVAIKFRLPDGTEIATTGFDSDAVASWSSNYIDVYQFGFHPFPVAQKVFRFDGHTLTDITSPGRVVYSCIPYTAFHWRSYLALLTAGIFLSWAGPALKQKVENKPARVLGLALVKVGWLIYLFILLLIPIYVLVLVALWALTVLGFRALQSRLQKPKAPMKLWAWAE